MFIIHLQFIAWFCEIAVLERENTFWKCTYHSCLPYIPVDKIDIYFQQNVHDMKHIRRQYHNQNIFRYS